MRRNSRKDEEKTSMKMCAYFRARQEQSLKDNFPLL